MKKIMIVGAVVLPMFFSLPLMADDVTDQIKAGLEAYEEKDYKTAVEELKFVTAQLEKMKQDENQKLLPDALEGWKKIESDDNGSQVAMAMFGGGGGSSMKGDYRRGKEEVSIEISANSPLMSMMNMMLKNPMMMAGQKNTKPFRYKKAKGMKKVERDTTEITLILVGQIMIKLTGKRLKDDAVLEEYLKELDLNKLKEALL